MKAVECRRANDVNRKGTELHVDQLDSDYDRQPPQYDTDRRQDGKTAADSHDFYRAMLNRAHFMVW